MKVLKVSLDDELDRKLREHAYQVYGNSKGALSKSIQDALKMFLYLPLINPHPKMNKNLQIFHQIKEKLEREEFGKFALISAGKFIGTFDSWEEAQNTAVRTNPTAEHGFIWQIGVQRKRKAKIGWRMKVATP